MLSLIWKTKVIQFKKKLFTGNNSRANAKHNAACSANVIRIMKV